MDISELAIDAHDEVLSLWRSCEGVGLSEADSREGIQAYLERNPGMSFVARIDGRLAGAVLCGHDGRRGYIHHLAVHPNYRKMGIGRLLVQECLDALRRAGIAKCHGMVFRDNGDAIAFWKTAGWTVREDIHLVSMAIGQDAPFAPRD